MYSYIIRGDAHIRPEETSRYGYWLTKFMASGSDALETWELNAPGTDFVKGASLALQYWKDQHTVCDKYGAEFTPPIADQICIISKGVFEGLPVQGVRYPSPKHMSGWWISTDEYDGNIRSLRHEHGYHLTNARPDLARYLALPYGFRFDLSTFEDVWFEAEVIKDGDDAARKRNRFKG